MGVGRASEGASRQGAAGVGASRLGGQGAPSRAATRPSSWHEPRGAHRCMTKPAETGAVSGRPAADVWPRGGGRSAAASPLRGDEGASVREQVDGPRRAPDVSALLLRKGGLRRGGPASAHQVRHQGEVCTLPGLILGEQLQLHGARPRAGQLDVHRPAIVPRPPGVAESVALPAPRRRLTYRAGRGGCCAAGWSPRR